MLTLGSFLLSLASVSNDPPDRDLVVGVRNGREDAFKALFDRYHPALFRFLIRMGLRTDITEDVLQDVFVGLWSARGRLDPSRSIRAYLYRACRNRAANHFRNRARFVDAPHADPVSKTPSQDEHLDHKQLQELLNEAVSRLPERQRAVFELCFINGLSYREAAEALDISTKTVENHMGYALKSIRRHISPFRDLQDTS